MEASTAFWDDLAQDLEDPEFLREHIKESIRISTIDAIVNELDEARTVEGLSKADLARAISVNPATMRRLFSGNASNPTLGTLAEVAAALGMRVSLEPLSIDEREAITAPLLEGKAANTGELVALLGELQQSVRATEVA